MTDMGFNVSAVTLGPIAFRALRTSVQTGKIHAVFASVFYAKLGRALITIATQSVAPGPLTITTKATTDWQKLGLTAEKTVCLNDKLLIIPGQVTVDLTRAELWSPIQTLPFDHNASLALARLKTVKLSPRNDGYGRTVVATSDWPHEVKQAWAWLRANLGNQTTDARQLIPLLGRGVGLTPAGDDFLGGMMIALHHLGHKGAAQTMWATLAPLAQTHTNAISYALLNAASKGFGSAPLHRVLNALTATNTKNLTKTLASLDQIGHSSGWDAFAGIVLVIRAQAALSAEIAA